MRTISKQSFKDHVTDMSILMSFFSLFLTTLISCLFLLLYSLLNFGFTFLTFWWHPKLDDMTADILNNRKLNSIVIELLWEVQN